MEQKTEDAPVELDEVDRRLLELLQRDGRMTNKALAEKAGLTPTPVLLRVKKLEQKGVISGYGARVNPQAVGKGCIAFVHVTQAEHGAERHRRFVESVVSFPEVLECHHLAGEEDFLLKVAVRDIAEYERFLLQHLSAIPGLARVKTTFVLSTAKEGPLQV